MLSQLHYRLYVLEHAWYRVGLCSPQHLVSNALRYIRISKGAASRCLSVVGDYGLSDRQTEFPLKYFSVYYAPYSSRMSYPLTLGTFFKGSCLSLSLSQLPVVVRKSILRQTFFQKVQLVFQLFLKVVINQVFIKSREFL